MYTLHFNRYFILTLKILCNEANEEPDPHPIQTCFAAVVQEHQGYYGTYVLAEAPKGYKETKIAVSDNRQSSSRQPDMRVI